MWARVIIGVVTFILFLSSTIAVRADSSFNITSSDSYQISSAGVATVTTNVVITNKKQFVYVPSYSINVALPYVSNVKATNSTGILKTNVIPSDNGSTIIVNFPKKLYGINKQNKFTLTYTADKFANFKKGAWEIVIPGLSAPETFSTYTTKITIPESFGDAVMITPLKKEKTGRTYTFQKDDFAKNGIYMLFKKSETNNAQQRVDIEFPKNVISGFPITGAIKITNTGGDSITNQTLTVKAEYQKNSLSYKVGNIDPYETLVIPVSLDRTPFLTMDQIQVKISFNGQTVVRKVNVGLLPDFYLIILGGVIIFGSIIVAGVTAKTWRLYIQKRK